MTKQELLNKADYYKDLFIVKEINNKRVAELAKLFKADYVNNSSALEDNTLNLSDTGLLLEEGTTESAKPDMDICKVSGHAEAYDYILSLAQAEQVDITEAIIKRLHYLYLYRTNQEQAGQYRKVCVNATDTHYLPPSPEELAHLMEHFINQMQSSRKLLHPIEYAALCQKRLMDIHPFEEGNGVVARLIMNLILINTGYTMAIINSEQRDEYINGLISARKKNNPDIDPLVKLIAESVIKSQLKYCKAMNIE